MIEILIESYIFWGNKKSPQKFAFFIKSEYTWEWKFYSLVLFMATNSQKTTNYKQIFRLTLLVFLVCLWRRGYLKVSDILIRYDIDKVQEKIVKRDAKLKSFSDKAGYDKLKYVQNLEANTHTMPWSDHIDAIMAIFGDLLDVDKSDTFNIEFSNFEISLERIRLDGHVVNLNVLYRWANSNTGLINKFEELDFLDNISIKTYKKSDSKRWYDFTLTANVINNGK